MIESLENNEVILLMYLADELPPQDRDDVERMLVIDAGMRAELERLQTSIESAHALLDTADETSANAFAARQTVVTRRIGRALRQEILERQRKAPVSVQRVGLRYPWWLYPTAAAAAIFLALLTWWGNISTTGPRGLPPLHVNRFVQTDPGNDPNDANVRMANDIERVFSTNNDADNALLALREDHSATGLDLGVNE